MLAIESHRNECLVIGEDLGRVVKGLRDDLRKWKILGCIVYLLENEELLNNTIDRKRVSSGLFSFGGHDFAPMRGFFVGEDLRELKKLGRIDDSVLADDMRKRKMIEDNLFNGKSLKVTSEQDRIAVLRGMKIRYRSRVHAVALDDVLGEHKPVNIPGTDREFPNWRRKYSRKIEDFPDCILNNA